MIDNPFASLERHLNRLESLLLEIKQTQTHSEPSGSDLEKPLSIKEAAALINLAVPTLYTMASQGTIPHAKKARRLYFYRQELLDWLKSGKRQTLDEIAKEAINGLHTGRRVR